MLSTCTHLQRYVRYRICLPLFFVVCLKEKRWMTESFCTGGYYLFYRKAVFRFGMSRAGYHGYTDGCGLEVKPCLLGVFGCRWNE